MCFYMTSEMTYSGELYRLTLTFITVLFPLVWLSLFSLCVLDTHVNVSSELLTDTVFYLPGQLTPVSVRPPWLGGVMVTASDCDRKVTGSIPSRSTVR